jgi:23S rRNA pseudouridine2457 synthase
MRMKSYFLFYKPYNVLSQFTGDGEHKSLRDFGPFAKNVYAAGRLDADSEGLLLLTDDNFVKHRLTDPKYGHERKYLVQVEGIPDGKDLMQLESGLLLGGKRTRPATVKILNGEPVLSPRPVPIRFRKSIPTSWLEMVLTEGRNRQVRRMTAAVGHATLRLIRISLLFLTIDGLVPGGHRELTRPEIRKLTGMLSGH